MPPHNPTHVLQPCIPLIALDTPLHTCALLLEVRLTEFAYWPRRNVTAVALLDGTQQAPCGHVRVISMLCLN